MDSLQFLENLIEILNNNEDYPTFDEDYEEAGFVNDNESFLIEDYYQLKEEIDYIYNLTYLSTSLYHQYHKYINYKNNESIQKNNTKKSLIVIIERLIKILSYNVESIVENPIIKVEIKSSDESIIITSDDLSINHKNIQRENYDILNEFYEVFQRPLFLTEEESNDEFTLRLYCEEEDYFYRFHRCTQEEFVHLSDMIRNSAEEYNIKALDGLSNDHYIHELRYSYSNEEGVKEEFIINKHLYTHSVVSPLGQYKEEYTINNDVLLNILNDLSYTGYEEDIDNGEYYEFVLVYADHEETIQGVYSLKGLPNDYKLFILRLLEYINSNSFSKVFSRKLFNRYDYIYYQVQFTPEGKEYYYIGDDTIEEEDFVLVHAGESESIGRVSHKYYCDKDDVPYPVEKTKRIIRKSSFEEYKNYIEGEN